MFASVIKSLLPYIIMVHISNKYFPSDRLSSARVLFFVRLSFLFFFGFLSFSSSFCQTNQKKRQFDAHGFLQKIKSISNGELTYHTKTKYLQESDTEYAEMKLRFFRSNTSPNAVTIYCERKEFSQIFFPTLTYSFYLQQGRGIFTNENLMQQHFSDFYPFVLGMDFSYLYALADTGTRSFDSLSMRVFSQSSRFRIYDSVYHGSSFKYCFDLRDSIPIYCQDIVEDNGEFQYEDYQLQSYKFNNFDSATFFRVISDSLASLTKRYGLESSDSVSARRPKIRESDTLATDFRYVSFAGDSAEFSTLLKANKLVLLDFWYQSCQPCRQAIPELVSIYNTYHEQGLEILGLDPFDTNRLSIQNTMKRLGINYPIGMGDTSIAASYKIQGYPTLFLIDSRKKILFYQKGYNENLKTRLSNMIEKYLHQ